MKNDEKKCPLTKMTCYGAECALWNGRECGLISAVEAVELIKNELYLVRKEMENHL